jgi:hypothetical protein
LSFFIFLEVKVKHTAIVRDGVMAKGLITYLGDRILYLFYLTTELGVAN